MGGVLFYIGEMKNFAFFQTRKFSKNVKKSMKNLYFLRIFKEILRFFGKLYRNFHENLGKYLENFGNMDL